MGWDGFAKALMVLRWVWKGFGTSDMVWKGPCDLDVGVEMAW